MLQLIAIFLFFFNIELCMTAENKKGEPRFECWKSSECISTAAGQPRGPGIASARHSGTRGPGIPMNKGEKLAPNKKRTTQLKVIAK